MMDVAGIQELYRYNQWATDRASSVRFGHDSRVWA